MTIEFITFLLAFIGFAGLATNAIYASFGKNHHMMMIITAAIITIHVLMVWAFRYEWQFSQATRNGYVGFLLFHSALSLIITSTAIAADRARMFIIMAFLIVVMGANGAVFIYDVVAIYRYPVILISITGLYFLSKNGYQKYLQKV